MQTVKSLLKNKGHAVWSIAPDATVYEALELMADKDVGALLVLEEGRVVGIISERDYARQVELKGKTAREMKVKDIMTTRVAYIRPEQTTDECMALMTDKHIRHLPVLDENKLIGVISIGDVVKSVISAQEFVIQQLENYIKGGEY